MPKRRRRSEPSEPGGSPAPGRDGAFFTRAASLRKRLAAGRGKGRKFSPDARAAIVELIAGRPAGTSRGAVLDALGIGTVVCSWPEWSAVATAAHASRRNGNGNGHGAATVRAFVERGRAAQSAVDALGAGRRPIEPVEVVVSDGPRMPTRPGAIYPSANGDGGLVLTTPSGYVVSHGTVDEIAALVRALEN